MVVVRCWFILCLFHQGAAFTCFEPLVIRAPRPSRAVVSLVEEAPAWFEDELKVEPASAMPDGAPATPAPVEPAESAAPAESATTGLSMSDLLNTKWKVKTTNRPDGWLPGPGQEQEFTLLDDSSVVWGGQAGGFGTGGRWQLTDSTLEVIRTTPLGLVTGRDYYMSVAQATINEKLQFELRGVIRSYNALYPVAVVADFVAERQPGRFVRNTDDDEKEA